MAARTKNAIKAGCTFDLTTKCCSEAQVCVQTASKYYHGLERDWTRLKHFQYKLVARTVLMVSWRSDVLYRLQSVLTDRDSCHQCLSSNAEINSQPCKLYESKLDRQALEFA